MEVINHKCSTCGSSLEYNIKNKNWKCKFCRSVYDKNNIDKHKNKPKISIKELGCPVCNAKLLVDKNIISTKCVYCRNNVVVNKTNDEFSIPDKLIPFSITKEKAKHIFFSILEKKKLLPDDFDLEQNITHITPVYIPFWLYSNKYKVIVRDKFIRVLQKNTLNFNYVPYDANKHLDNKITKSLEPFDYKDLIDFNSSYLSGVIAQKYDVDNSEGSCEIDDRCKNSIYYLFTNKKSNSYLRDANIVNSTLVAQKKYYALLPIWLLNISYNNKNYLIAINGQTGKFAGDLPIDKNIYKKWMVIYFITILLLLIIIVLLLRWLGVL